MEDPQSFFRKTPELTAQAREEVEQALARVRPIMDRLVAEYCPGIREYNSGSQPRE